MHISPFVFIILVLAVLIIGIVAGAYGLLIFRGSLLKHRSIDVDKEKSGVRNANPADQDMTKGE